MALALGALWLASAPAAAGDLAAVAGGPLVEEATQARQAARADTASLTIVDQVDWVGPRGEFWVTVSARATDDDSVVQPRVYLPTEDPALVGAGKLTARALRRGDAVPLRQGTQQVTLRLAVVPDADGTPGDPLVADPGVYPVRVELIDGNGDRAAEVVTYLVHLGTGDKQPLSVVIPLGFGGARDDRGRPVVDTALVSALDRRIAVLNAYRELPVALWPSPETVAGLREATGPASSQASATLDRLRTTARGNTVISSTFVPMDEAAWLAAGFADLVNGELDLGAESLESAGALPSGARPVVGLTGPATSAIDATLSPRGAKALVTGATVEGGAIPVIQPLFVVNAAGDQPTEEQQRQAVRQLLASLAVTALHTTSPSPVVLQLEAPESTDPAILRTLLQALAGPSPFDVVDLTAVIANHPTPAVASPSPNGTAAEQPQPSPARLTQTREAITTLASLITVVGESAPEVAALRADLLVAPASDLTDAQAAELLATISTGAKAASDGLELPRQQSIVVTSHRARLPFVIRNHTNRTLKVALRVRSSELEFTGPQPMLLDVPPGSTDVELPIRTRRSGEFELAVEVRSPDGGLVLATTQITVQSRAISGVGVALSVGAAVFLVVWWVRNHRRRPRGDAPPAGNASVTPNPDATLNNTASSEAAPPGHQPASDPVQLFPVEGAEEPARASPPLP